ncbi:hypothetical protein SAMN02745180_01383 [Sporanaerobacter acetigenes DSM 13106]|uniref:Uncharacterized protein n=2 Tax=Sporanaerobacter acetigenes TaxID=165813 RepID=A0A1M5WS69_9FIRM|nr:hypothetical protein SAMN02745180_01383 [Sporanaerobacter acetigenes DSM 13106]
MIMYIKLINCSAVHIYQESAYVYTDSAIYVLDEISCIGMSMRMEQFIPVLIASEKNSVLVI